MPKLAAVGPGTAEALRGARARAGARRRRLDAGRAARGAAAAGGARSRRGRGRRAHAARRRARRRLRRRCTGRACCGRRAAARAISSCSPPAPPPVPSPRSASTFPPSRSGPQTTIAAEAAGLEVVAEAATHDLDGLVAAVRSAAVFITFLTDFGLADDFVGTCHGVIKTIAPEAQIIDITHGISPRQVLQGALVLANTICLHAARAFTSRSSIPASARRAGRSRCATRRGGSTSARTTGCSFRRPSAAAGSWRRTSSRAPPTRSRSVSRTFHGRDLFAPAAAHLALGVPIEQLGPPVDPESLIRLDVPEPEVGGDRIRATVLDVDRFGNVGLNLTREHLERAGVVPGHAGRARVRRRALLRARGAHLRRREARRHRPLRELLPRDRRRDQPRQRRRDPRRAPGLAGHDPPRPALTLRAVARRPRVPDQQGRSRRGHTGPDVLSSSARLPPPGEVAQLVEHTAENRGVAGSSPALATRPEVRPRCARA